MRYFKEIHNEHAGAVVYFWSKGISTIIFNTINDMGGRVASDNRLSRYLLTHTSKYSTFTELSKEEFEQEVMLESI